MRLSCIDSRELVPIVDDKAPALRGQELCPPIVEDKAPALRGQRAITACNRVGSAQTVRVEPPRISVHASSATHMRAVRMVFVRGEGRRGGGRLVGMHVCGEIVTGTLMPCFCTTLISFRRYLHS